MPRALFPQTLLWMIFMAQAVLPAAAQNSPNPPESVRIYDVRDLLADLPDAEPKAAGASNLGLTLVRTAAAPPMRSTSFFDILCTVLPINESHPLTPGIYAVRTDEANHKELMRMLNELRAVFVERYEVEITCYAATGQAPALGAPAKLDSPALRQRAVLVRRFPTPVYALTQHRYVSELQPIVAQSTAAYQANTGAMDDGLALVVTVGAGPEDQASTVLHAQGELTLVKLGKSAAFTATGGAEAKLDLPSVLRRSVQTNLQIEFNKPTVIAVATGYEEGQTLVVTATVRKLVDAGGGSRK